MNTADKTRAETQACTHTKVSDNESKGKSASSEERESDETTCDNEKQVETYENDAAKTYSTLQKESVQTETQELTDKITQELATQQTPSGEKIDRSTDCKEVSAIVTQEEIKGTQKENT